MQCIVACAVSGLPAGGRWMAASEQTCFTPTPGQHTCMKASRDVSPLTLFFPGGQSPGAPGALWGFVLLCECGSDAQSGLTQDSWGLQSLGPWVSRVVQGGSSVCAAVHGAIWPKLQYGSGAPERGPVVPPRATGSPGGAMACAGMTRTNREV